MDVVSRKEHLPISYHFADCTSCVFECYTIDKMKIDCHLHLPVREELHSLDAQKKHLLQELTTNHIDYGIIIPDNTAESSIGNLQQCTMLFKNEQRIFIMASVNILREPTSSVHEFDHLFKNDKIVALKIFPGHDEHLPNDMRLTPFIELCLRYDAPFVIHTGWNSGNPSAARWNDPKYIVDLSNKYDELKILICHYYWPAIEYCYEITRDNKNIHFDISGLADKEVESATGKEKIKNIIEKTITDNPKSLLFGSDYGMCDLNSHIQFVNSLDISQEIQAMIYCQNAIDLFHLKIQK